MGAFETAWDGLPSRRESMTFVVNESCIKCKLMDCVEVCPVDCFYEGENMLVIHPDECIDCGVCVPECPVDHIFCGFASIATRAARSFILSPCARSTATHERSAIYLRAS